MVSDANLRARKLHASAARAEGFGRARTTFRPIWQQSLPSRRGAPARGLPDLQSPRHHGLDRREPGEPAEPRTSSLSIIRLSLGGAMTPIPTTSASGSPMRMRCASSPAMLRPSAVLQRLAAVHSKDMEILGAYGKALVDAGRLQEAADVLPQAHTPENPNWTILSAQGTVADQLGDHVKAQEYYMAALKIAPNQPDVLSNLGLSYALAKQLPLAEQTLERAAAQPGADGRVRQNLALVLALEGKFDQAQTVAQHDLQPLQAAENVAAIRQMVAQANPWNEIRALDGKPHHKIAARKNVSRKVATIAKPAEPAPTDPARIDADHPTTTAAE